MQSQLASPAENGLSPENDRTSEASDEERNAEGVSQEVCESDVGSFDPAQRVMDIETLFASLSSRTATSKVPLTEISYTFETVDEVLRSEKVSTPPGRLIFHRIVIDQDHYVLALLLMSRYRDLLNELDSFGRSPLHLALMLADVTAVQLLLCPPVWTYQCFLTSNLPINFCDVAMFYAGLPPAQLALYSSVAETNIPTIESILWLLFAYFDWVYQVQPLEDNSASFTANLAFNPNFDKVCPWSQFFHMPSADEGSTESESRTLPHELFLEFLSSRSTPPVQEWGWNAPDYLKQTILHRACSLGLTALVKSLTSNRTIDLFAKDAYGHLALHHAILAGNAHCISALLDRMRHCVPHEGLQLAAAVPVMHLLKQCILRGQWTCMGTLVLSEAYSQSPISEIDFDELTEFASLCGFSAEFSQAFHEAINGTIPANTTTSAIYASRVKVFYHHDCLEHLHVATDALRLSNKHLRSFVRYPENPTRLQSLIPDYVGIFSSSTLSQLTFQPFASAIPIADILRVHEWSYIHRITQLAKRVIREIDSGVALSSPSPIVQNLDSDTVVGKGTWQAATAAAGTVLAAVHAVCSGEVRSAFCAVRPPGHHVGTWGACQFASDASSVWAPYNEEDWIAGSQGFCLLNNVAIGAAYARYHYADSIRRIAIVDIDVHHGNGTEQIVRNLRPRARQITMSAPRANDFTLDVQYTENYWKPWLNESDPDEVAFISIHGFGHEFYPGTGGHLDPFSVPISNTMNIPVPMGISAEEYRLAFVDKVIGALVQFQPDIIFISAGFDGHFQDITEQMFGGLTEVDYEWMTRYLVAVANEFCEGRIVSVLEGGYNTLAGPLSPLASSVAAHLRALHDTSESLVLSSMRRLATPDNWKFALPHLEMSLKPLVSETVSPVQLEDGLAVKRMKRRPREAALKAHALIERYQQKSLSQEQP